MEKIENLTFFINFNKSIEILEINKKSTNSSNYFDRRNHGGIIDIHRFDSNVIKIMEKIENLTFFIIFNESIEILEINKKSTNSSNYVDRRNCGGIIDIDSIKITSYRKSKISYLLYKLYINFDE